jgi:hypothetical protein
MRATSNSRVGISMDFRFRSQGSRQRVGHPSGIGCWIFILALIAKGFLEIAK